MSNPDAPSQVTDAVASVIHGVSTHAHMHKSFSLPYQVRLHHHWLHDKGYEIVALI